MVDSPLPQAGHKAVMLKGLGEKPTKGFEERATDQRLSTQQLPGEDQVVPMGVLAAVPHGQWHPLVSFISSQTLYVHMGPQFRSINTSVWLFRAAFELLIPQISTPYVPITGWTAASQTMSWPPVVTTILRSLDPTPWSYGVCIQN